MRTLTRAGYCCLHSEEPFGRFGAERDDDAWLDELDLVVEVRGTGHHFSPPNWPIAGRSAHGNVRDIDVGPTETDVCQEPVEVRAGGPTEGTTFGVLFLTRSLAHDHEISLVVAFAEHDAGARAGEFAPDTCGGEYTEGGQVSAAGRQRHGGNDSGGVDC